MHQCQIQPRATRIGIGGIPVSFRGEVRLSAASSAWRASATAPATRRCGPRAPRPGSRSRCPRPGRAPRRRPRARCWDRPRSAGATSTGRGPRRPACSRSSAAARSGCGHWPASAARSPEPWRSDSGNPCRRRRIEQRQEMGEVDPPGLLVLELFQAAARAAVAQALPFGVGHLFQRLGFPEESVLVRSALGARS